MAKAKLFPVVILQNDVFDHRREEKYGTKKHKKIDIASLQDRVLTVGRPILHHGRRPKVLHARTHETMSFVVSWEEEGEISFSPYYSYGKFPLAEALAESSKFMRAKDAIEPFFEDTGVSEHSSAWDITGQLLTPFVNALCGYPALTAAEADGSRLPEIQAIADCCQADDQIQPFFLIGGQNMTAHELIEASSRAPRWIDLYSRLNLWDHRFDIQKPQIIGG